MDTRTLDSGVRQNDGIFRGLALLVDLPRSQRKAEYDDENEDVMFVLMYVLLPVICWWPEKMWRFQDASIIEKQVCQ